MGCFVQAELEFLVGVLLQNVLGIDTSEGQGSTVELGERIGCDAVATKAFTVPLELWHWDSPSQVPFFET